MLSHSCPSCNKVSTFFFFSLLSYEGIRAFFPLSSTDFKVGVPLHIEG